MINMLRPDIQTAAKEKLKAFLVRHFTSNEQDIVAAYNQGFLDGMKFEVEQRTNNADVGFDKVKEELEDQEPTSGAV